MKLFKTCELLSGYLISTGRMMELDFSSVTSLLLAGTVTALLFIYMMRKTSDKYPPGPFAFPIIGNSPQILLSGSLAKFIESNHQKFGNVFTFVSGGSKRVVVSGYDAIYRLLVKNADCTSTRSIASMTPTIKIAAQKTPGVFWAPYPLWKDLRSFSISSMRDEGMGKSTLEPQLIEEIELFIAHFIEPNLNNPIEMTLGLSQATNNMISQMMFHRRFDYDDEAFKTRIESINESFSIGLKISMIGNLPFGKYFIKSAIERDDYIMHTILLPALQHLIDEHKDDLDEHNPRDIMDKYLIQSQKEQNEGKANHSYSEENARILAFQMYIAGTETTATALRWALLFMCLHPDVKVKVQNEISEHLGIEHKA
ncbi:hypothetical protein EB796_000838 [Bugula neritina]|uniref:Uncharacterized protein n=1 Tax=Bugula neritina TaxID=10212 RepID=A0A7J7KRW8_BUGNE|nr:hypothetical protein EB796_000838 [Bugula neritina]